MKRLIISLLVSVSFFYPLLLPAAPIIELKSSDLFQRSLLGKTEWLSNQSIYLSHKASNNFSYTLQLKLYDSLLENDHHFDLFQGLVVYKLPEQKIDLFVGRQFLISGLHTTLLDGINIKKKFDIPAEFETYIGIPRQLEFTDARYSVTSKRNDLLGGRFTYYAPYFTVSPFINIEGFKEKKNRFLTGISNRFFTEFSFFSEFYLNVAYETLETYLDEVVLGTNLYESDELFVNIEGARYEKVEETGELKNYLINLLAAGNQYKLSGNIDYEILPAVTFYNKSGLLQIEETANEKEMGYDFTFGVKTLVFEQMSLDLCYNYFKSYGGEANMVQLTGIKPFLRELNFVQTVNFANVDKINGIRGDVFHAASGIGYTFSKFTVEGALEFRSNPEFSRDFFANLNLKYIP